MKKRTRRCNPQRQAYAAFFLWRRKLSLRSRPSGVVSKPRFKASEVAPGTSSPEQRPSLHRGAPSFLPAHLTQDGPAVAAHGVEIVLARGCTVRVKAGFDRQTLADVLAVLEVRPC